MRLDKFLQVTGVFKRRAAAKGACEEGRVLLNQGVARPARGALPGQVIEIQAGQRKLRVQVLGVPTGNVGKGEEREFIRILEEKSRGQ